MPVSAAARSIPQAARAFLSRPDGILSENGATPAVEVAVRACIGLTGAAVFFAIVVAGFVSVSPELPGEGVASLWRLMAVPPTATLLSFPPLVLVAALQGREPNLARLAGVAAGGPAMAGTWLGAGAPVLLLFLLSGEIDAAFALLALGLCLVGGMAGAVGAVRNARRAGASAPGALTVLAHYALFGWTALVLSLHLV
jgi:hypothetical protein